MFFQSKVFICSAAFYAFLVFIGINAIGTCLNYDLHYASPTKPDHMMQHIIFMFIFKLRNATFKSGGLWFSAIQANII